MHRAGKRRRIFLTPEARSVLKEWLAGHEDCPYPTDLERVIMAKHGGVTVWQVCSWFANARTRLRRDNHTFSR